MAWGIILAVSFVAIRRGACELNDLQLYSIGGGVFLLTLGQYFFFFFPEWHVPSGVLPSRISLTSISRQIYGGIGVGIGVVAILNVLALSNVGHSFELHSCHVAEF